MSVKPETTGIYQGTIILPRNKRPPSIQCTPDTRAILDNLSSQSLRDSISPELKRRLPHVTPSIRVKWLAYLNPFRRIRVKPAKQDHGKQSIL